MLDSNSTEIPMLLMALRIISACSECSRYFAIRDFKYWVRYTTAVKSAYKATNPQICKSCAMVFRRLMCLPDTHPILRREIKFFVGLYLELPVPGIDIAHGISTIFARGMFVCQ